MKRKFLPIAIVGCVLCVVSVMAQDYFYAHYNDGSINKFSTANLDSISLICPDGVLTGDGTVSDVCGNKYSYVKIGELLWMTKNMRCLKSVSEYGIINDDFYQRQQGYPTIDNCCRDGGYLYYIDALQFRNYCPIGWRLPTKNDLIALLDYTKNKNVSLLSTTGWSVESNDEYGFSLLRAGYCSTEYNSPSCGGFIPSSDSYGLWVKNGGEDICVDARAYTVKVENGSFVQYKTYKITHAPIRCCREDNISDDSKVRILNK